MKNKSQITQILPISLRFLASRIRLRTYIALGLIAILLPLIFIRLSLPSGSEAAWYDAGYAYRKAFTFTHNAALTDRRVTVTIDTASLTTDKMQADCDDIRFTDSNGKLLRYQLLANCDSASTTFDVVFPTIINGVNLGYVYYGNPSAISASEDVSSYTSLSPSGGNESYASEETGPGPIAWWKLDDAQGTTAQDNTRSNADGSISGATWQTNELCIEGNCLFFDGSNDVVTVASTVNNIQTVSFWVRLQSTSTTQELIDLNGTDYITSVSGTITANGFGTETIYVDGKPGTTLVANRWHFIEVTTSSALSGSAITIGNVSTNYGQGFIDEVRIYPYARSSTQVKADYQKYSSVLIGSSNVSVNSDGLVGYWKMNDAGIDAEGETITDASGNSNSGTLFGDNSTGDNGSGMDCTAVGKYSSGCSFDGTDDYIQVTNTTALNPTFITVSAWVKTSASGQTDMIIGKDHTAGNNRVFQFRKETTNELRFLVFTNDSTFDNATSTQTINDGNWHHVTGTWDGETIKVYVDGELDGSTAFSGSSLNPGQTNDLFIGRSENNDPSYFTGTIDDARIYNRALSGAEVADLYNFAPGPVGYWNLNENTGSTAYDISTNANDLSLTNSPTWSVGKYGSGVNFAGSNQHLLRADDDDFDFSDDADMSISMFFKHTTASAQEVLLSKYNEAGYKIIMESDGDITCALDYDSTWTPTDFATSTAATYDNNTWHHVECVKSGASSLSLYIDGQLIVTDSSLTADNTLTNTDPLYIGIDADATSNDFIGQIDEVKIYRYARSPGQIVEDLNGGHPIGGSPIGSQIAYWGFDEQQGATTNNRVGVNSSITGAISGATWKTKSDCKINGCLDFDGSDDVVTVTNTNAIDFDTNLAAGFTFSAWMYPDSDGEGDTGQIFYKGTNTWCRVDTESGGNLDIQCSLDLTTTDATLNISAPITTSSWNHFAVSYTDDSDDEITIWINGNARGVSTDGSGSPAITDTADLLIGGTTTANFDGKIDEFKVYNSELTAEQIKIDLNAGSAANYGTTANSEASLLSDGAGNYPIGEWNFDENTNNTCAGGTDDACDTSGNGNDGTANGSPAWVVGKIGSALSFNGSSSYVDLGAPAIFDLGSGNFTYQAWVNTTITPANQSMIIGQDVNGTPHRQLKLTSANLIAVSCRDSSSNDLTASSTSTVNDGQWHFVVTVRNGSSIYIYIDGVLEATGTNASTGSCDSPTNTIVGRRNGGAPFYFNGLIDQVKIYNYARSQAQVAYDYNRGAPIAWWKFDECVGATTYDASGNSYNGTITIGGSGTQTSVGSCVTSSTAWGNGVTGKFNSSLRFDGTDDSISVSDTANLRFDSSTADYSLFVWVKRTTTGTEYLLSKEDADNDGWRLMFNSSNQVVCSEDTTDVTSSSTITDTNWHHIGCSIDRDGNGQVYIDGQPNGTATSMGTDAMATTSNIAIGTRSYTATSYFNGQLDGIQIYNYALSAAQIRQVMNQNAGVRFGPQTGSP